MKRLQFWGCAAAAANLPLVLAFGAFIWARAQDVPPPVAPAPPAADSALYDPATKGCAYTLATPASCSAGVFLPDGKLVRTLFTMRAQDAGTYSIVWDGNDDAGRPAPDGCAVRVVANRSTYKNAGAIGQNPANPKEHIPGSSSVAVAPDGTIFTANGWDEAGESVSRRNPDGSSRAGYGVAAFLNPHGMPYAVAVDDQYFYATNGTMVDTGQRVIRWRYHGPDPDHNDPAPWTGTGQADGWILVRPKTDGELQAPLPALAASPFSIWVVDVVDRVVHRYDKATGRDLGSYPVPLVRSVAIDAANWVWVGTEDGTVGTLDTASRAFAPRLKGQGVVVGLDFSPDGKTLAVADAAAGQVRLFAVAGTSIATPPRRTLGQKASPGDRAADRFYQLRAVGLFPDGSVLTAQTEPVHGARLAKFGPDGSTTWELFSTEFTSAANTGPGDPDMLYSSTFHRYTLGDRAAGTWQYAGNAVPGTPLRWSGQPHHPVTVARIAGRDYVFFPTNMDVLVCLVDGPVLRPVAALGGADPVKQPDDRTAQFGRWSWTDADDDGQVDAAELTWATPLGQGRAHGRSGADRAGNLFILNNDNRSVWTIPLGPPSPKGYPTYDWTKARQVVAADPAPGAFFAQLAVPADDGSVYACGWNRGDPRRDQSAWQASGVLCRFAPDGTKLWAVQPPELICGLDTVPGPDGGVIVGGHKSASLYHYTADGLLVGQVGPGPAMGNRGGYFDILGAVNVGRDRAGAINVFCERVSPGGIAWYVIDDHGLATLGPAPPAASPVLTVDSVDEQQVTLSSGGAKATLPRAFVGKVKAGDKVTIGGAAP